MKLLRHKSQGKCMNIIRAAQFNKQKKISQKIKITLCLHKYSIPCGLETLALKIKHFLNIILICVAICMHSL